MSMTVSTRVKHLTSGKAAGQRRHDERVGVIPEYVDRERTKDNSVIQPTMLESEARRRCEHLRAQNPHSRAMKSNAAVITSGIITFGNAAQKVIVDLPVDEQNAIYQDIADKIAERLETRLVGLSVHRDESAPHAHYAMLAVNKHGNPLSKTIDKATARALQDIAGEVMAAHQQPQITRGKPKLQRIKDGEPAWKWINMTVTELHEALPRQLSTLREIAGDAQAMLDDIYQRQDDADSLLKEKMDKVRYYEALAEKAKAQAELENANLEKLKKRVSTYENRVNKLLEDIAKLENSDSKEVREALESTGVVSKREVIFAGSESENEEPEPIFQVNHDNDLDWD
jgi:hypothetical protein